MPSLQWRHNDRDGVSKHRRLHCLLNRFFRRSSKKSSKLRVTGLCEGSLPVTGEFPAQKNSNAENVSICWRQHVSFSGDDSMLLSYLPHSLYLGSAAMATVARKAESTRRNILDGGWRSSLWSSSEAVVTSQLPSLYIASTMTTISASLSMSSYF